jgi:hypothetical protein
MSLLFLVRDRPSIKPLAIIEMSMRYPRTQTTTHPVRQDWRSQTDTTACSKEPLHTSQLVAHTAKRETLTVRMLLPIVDPIDRPRRSRNRNVICRSTCFSSAVLFTGASLAHHRVSVKYSTANGEDSCSILHQLGLMSRTNDKPIHPSSVAQLRTTQKEPFRA